MTDLFDSSAIYYMTRRGISHPIAEGGTISLAPYEIGNVIWKEHNLHKHLGRREAEELIEVVTSIVDNMQKVSLRGMQTRIFELASKLNVSYYDASYVIAASNAGGSLITEDKRLAQKISSLISVKTCEELLSAEVQK